MTKWERNDGIGIASFYNASELIDVSIGHQQPFPSQKERGSVPSDETTYHHFQSCQGMEPVSDQVSSSSCQLSGNAKDRGMC